MSTGVYTKYVKRGIDVFISIMVLVLFWWVYAILAVIVAINLGTPVLFTQDRPGKNGKIFKLYNVFKIEGDADFCNKELNNTCLAA